MKTLMLIPPSKFAKNVARDLIYGCWCKGKRIGGIKFPPVSQLIVVTYLRKHGIPADLLDAASTLKHINELYDIIKKYRSVIMLTSTMTVNEDALLLNDLKRVNPELKTIVYGSHPTFMPLYTLEKKGIDFVIQREPERVALDLIKALSTGEKDIKNIKGIGFVQKNRVVITPPAPLIEDLDELPIPDRSLLPKNIDYYNPIVKKLPYTTMITSRGCPGRCTFCSVPFFYGNKIRWMSVKRVMDEIDQIVRMGYKEIFFRDEMFTASRKRVMEICERIIKKNYKLKWIASTRADMINEEMLKIMKQAGCHMIRVGVESGSQKVLNNIKKGTRLEQVETLFRLTNKLKIDTHAHLMVGMTGETKEDVEKTIKLILKIKPTIITAGVCTPYPGTDLFKVVAGKDPSIKDGSKSDLAGLHTEAFYNEYFSKMTKEEISRSVKRIYRKFYFRLSYIINWLFKLSSVDELRRVTIAATKVLDFIFRGDKPREDVD